MRAGGPPAPACTVLIAARDEEDGIAACLRGFAEAEAAPLLQVIVVANGCGDRTAEVAHAAGAEVIETAVPGKAKAIALGEARAGSGARLYVDADVAIPARDVDRLVATLQAPGGTPAATVQRRVDATRSSLPVRAYYAIHTRLPVFSTGLTGRGVIGLTEAGRRRFGPFPDVTGDDFFLDSLFTPEEVTVLDSGHATVLAPGASAELLRRLVRVRRGNRLLREAASAGAAGPSGSAGTSYAAASAVPSRSTRSARSSWLTDVVLPRPRLWAAAPVYAAFTLLAEFRARRQSVPEQWERGR